jgi:3-methyladenine DNA glycosylase/8-oxoguanine DNA glycosylase
MVARARYVKTPRGALARLRAADPALGEVIDRVGRFRMALGHAGDPFNALARSIVYQQLSGNAAATIFGRVQALFPDGVPSPARLLAMRTPRLRKAGLSRQKEAALRDLSRHVASGALPVDRLHTLEDEELATRLQAVRGIGRWSAEMFMMFHLGRPDVWPCDDLGVRKAVAKLRGRAELPHRREMLVLGEPYRPFRSVAAWYLWRSLELED